MPVSVLHTRRVFLTTVFLAAPFLSDKAWCNDFFPLAIGDTWVYSHEVLNGNFIGDIRRDTCVVEITDETFQPHDDMAYFTSGMLLGADPCRPIRNSQLRKDGSGNIWFRPESLDAQPDTAAFIEQYPAWADEFRRRLLTISHEREVLLYNFAMMRDYSAGTESSAFFTNAFLGWYSGFLMRTIGFAAVRDGRELGQEISAPRFVPDAEHAVFYTDSTGEVQKRIEFEAGLGVTFVQARGVISPWISTTTLLWAEVGGKEYGRRPTAVTLRPWAVVKKPTSDYSRQRSD